MAKSPKKTAHPDIKIELDIGVFLSEKKQYTISVRTLSIEKTEELLTFVEKNIKPNSNLIEVLKNIDATYETSRIESFLAATSQESFGIKIRAFYVTLDLHDDVYNATLSEITMPQARAFLKKLEEGIKDEKSVSAILDELTPQYTYAKRLTQN